MRLAVLTPREREVVLLVATGLSNHQIAQRLVISPLTAKTHVTRAIAKLGLHDRVQLVILAYETGLVRPGRHGAATDEGATDEGAAPDRS
jgi:DNA-binding NarL/FixJ family response regulator